MIVSRAVTSGTVVGLDTGTNATSSASAQIEYEFLQYKPR